MESIGIYNGAGVGMDGLDATELRLAPPGTTSPPSLVPIAKTKRSLEEDPTVELSSKSSCCSNTEDTSSYCNDPTGVAEPPAKTQVVGWPPVQAFRVRSNAASLTRKGMSDMLPKKETATTSAAACLSGLLVKISMDGAPYLRKIDLGAYKGYKELRLALDAMFRCFLPGALHQQESAHSVMTYEDKDGDWMLVGDVPWEMFASSCKRLRVMKGSVENRVSRKDGRRVSAARARAHGFFPSRSSFDSMRPPIGELSFGPAAPSASSAACTVDGQKHNFPANFPDL